jgi:hypothetical protein
MRKSAEDAATARKATDEAVLTKETAAKANVDSAALGQAPTPATGVKRVAMPSGSTPPAKRPYKGVWKPRFVESSVIYFLHYAVAVAFPF